MLQKQGTYYIIKIKAETSAVENRKATELVTERVMYSGLTLWNQNSEIDKPQQTRAANKNETQVNHWSQK